MKYEEYTAICAKCNARNGPAELCKGCAVRTAVENEGFRMIMELTHEERRELLTRWKNRKASCSTADQSTPQEAI